jgi:hypothetical protein
MLTRRYPVFYRKPRKNLTYSVRRAKFSKHFRERWMPRLDVDSLETWEKEGIK